MTSHLTIWHWNCFLLQHQASILAKTHTGAHTPAVLPVPVKYWHLDTHQTHQLGKPGGYTEEKGKKLIAFISCHFLNLLKKRTSKKRRFTPKAVQGHKWKKCNSLTISSSLLHTCPPCNTSVKVTQTCRLPPHWRRGHTKSRWSGISMGCFRLLPRQQIQGHLSSKRLWGKVTLLKDGN